VRKNDGKYVYDRIGGLLLGNVLMPSLEGSDSSDNAKIKLYMLFEPGLREEASFQSSLNVFSFLVHSFRDKYSKDPASAVQETR